MEELKNEYNSNLYRFKRYIEFKDKQFNEYSKHQALYEDEASKILKEMDRILIILEKSGVNITQSIVENGFEGVEDTL